MGKESTSTPKAGTNPAGNFQDKRVEGSRGMKVFLKYLVIGSFLIFALVLIFGFSVNGKLGSTEIDFSINGIPRYETLTLGHEVYVIDRRTGEAKLLISGMHNQLGKTFRKMLERPQGSVADVGSEKRSEEGKDSDSAHENRYWPF